MSHIDQIFEISKKGNKETRLEMENRRLKAMIGDLTIELKKAKRIGHDESSID